MPVIRTAGDLLIPVAAAAPTSGVALGLWRTDDPLTLPCAVPMDMTTTVILPDVDTAFYQTTISMFFEDITPLCVQGTSNMTAFDPCSSEGAGVVAKKSPDLRIWPSPTSGHFTISNLAAERVELTDISGRVLLATRSPATGELALDISSWPVGLYHVRAVTPTGHRTGGLMKE
jgi:type IV secretory pathway protease TraF